MLMQHFCYLFIIIATFLALYIGIRAKEEYRMFLKVQNVVKLDFFYFYTFGAIVGTLSAAYGLAYMFIPDNSLIVGPIGVLMRSAVVLFAWLLWRRPYNLGYIPVLLTSALATGLMFSIPLFGIGINHELIFPRPWSLIPSGLSFVLIVYLLYKIHCAKVNGITKVLAVSVFFNLLSSLAMVFSSAKFDALHLISTICFALVFIPLFFKLIYIKQ